MRSSISFSSSWWISPYHQGSVLALLLGDDFPDHPPPEPGLEPSLDPTYPLLSACCVLSTFHALSPHVHPMWQATTIILISSLGKLRCKEVCLSSRPQGLCGVWLEFRPWHSVWSPECYLVPATSHRTDHAVLCSLPDLSLS